MQISGRLVAVQEQRFRLAADGGQVLLLTLSRHAPQGQATLEQLQREFAHVTVHYTGEPNLESAVAHSVQEDGR